MKIDFIFDVASPNAYLCHKVIPGIENRTGKTFNYIPCLLGGIFKITNYDGTVGWMEGYGVPGILIIPAIIIEILGPILIIVGYQTRITAAFLSLFCLVTAIIFHNEFSNQMQLTSFLKNTALAGGFLFLVINGSKKFSLDNKLK